MVETLGLYRFDERNMDNSDAYRAGIMDLSLLNYKLADTVYNMRLYFR